MAPFDFSRSELGLDVTVKGKALFMLLDTGIDPSVIDLKRAQDLGLPIDMKAGGESDGIGDGKAPQAYPATIDGLALEGRAFGPVKALTADLGDISAHYGRRLDGFLGFSFLHDKIVLVDYPAHSLAILDRVSDARQATVACRRRYQEPMGLLKDQNWPLTNYFHIGDASLPATLDTGASGSITLYDAALTRPGVSAALTETGKSASTGLRGTSRLTNFTLNTSAGIGPFRLPPGQPVELRDIHISRDASTANLGNKLFAQLGLKVLFDYRHRKLIVFGDCG